MEQATHNCTESCPLRDSWISEYFCDVWQICVVWKAETLSRSSLLTTSHTDHPKLTQTTQPSAMDGLLGNPGIFFLWMFPANERLRYFATSSLIGRVHTQNDPCIIQNGWWNLVWYHSTLGVYLLAPGRCGSNFENIIFPTHHTNHSLGTCSMKLFSDDCHKTN